MKKYIALLALLASSLVHANDITVEGVQSLLTSEDPYHVQLANGYISGFRDGFAATLDTTEEFDTAWAYCGAKKIWHTDIIAARLSVQDTGTENLYSVWFLYYVFDQCPELTGSAEAEDTRS